MLSNGWPCISIYCQIVTQERGVDFAESWHGINGPIHKTGRTILHSACLVEKNFDVIIRILDTKIAKIDPVDHFGLTPLFYCITDTAAATMLIDAGANIFAKDPHGYSIMDYAVFHGKVSVVNKLIDAGITEDADNKRELAKKHLVKEQEIIKSFVNNTSLNNYIDSLEDTSIAIHKILSMEQQIALAKYYEQYYQDNDLEMPQLVKHHACVNKFTYSKYDCSFLEEKDDIVEVHYVVE